MPAGPSDRYDSHSHCTSWSNTRDDYHHHRNLQAPLATASAPWTGSLTMSIPGGSGEFQREPTSMPPPQRVGTVSSGGDVFSVSPASSIHGETDDDVRGEYYGYGSVERGGGLSPSPVRQVSDLDHNNGRDAAARTGWRGPGAGEVLGLRDGGGGGGGKPGLWDLPPDPIEIPLPPPQHWRGSRELQELTQARVREAVSGRRPSLTSYGPAPMPAPIPIPNSTGTSASVSFSPVEAAAAPVAPVVTATSPTTGVEITPSSVPWQSSWQEEQTPVPPARPPGPGVRVRRHGMQNSNGSGPFMHYEDLDYFRRPSPESGEPPKDESQVGGDTMPRADTFPSIAGDDVGSPQARWWWDRQRRRRRKTTDPIDTGKGLLRGGRGGGMMAIWRYCAQWTQEVLCSLVGLACFGAIIALLKVYDGRGLPDWPLAVSLNTVVAFLTAICQVALAVPLTEGLSQLMWNSFARGDKPLGDFQTFQNAKRGPVGSAVLLCKRKGRLLGMTGATTLLTGFLLSPLTQGAITYPTRQVQGGSGTAVVSRSESYSHPEPYAVLDGSLDTREKQAIQSGIYHAVDQPVPHLQPLCSSGDCQWRNFSSLAVCAAVADVSDRLTVSEGTLSANGDIAVDTSNASLPNGLHLIGGLTTGCNLNISWPRNSTGDGVEQENFLPARMSLAFSSNGDDGRVASAIANFFIIYTSLIAERPAGPNGASSDTSTSVFQAVEVLLHFCVNTYEISTARGVSSSRVVHSSSLTTSAQQQKRQQQGEPAVMLRSRQDQGGGGSIYSVKRDDVRLLNGYILSLFSGTYSYWYGTRIGNETPTSGALGQALFRRAVPATAANNPEEYLRDVVRNMTNNVATSLSNAIRAMSPAMETGVVLARETYVHVEWAWLSFLALQMAMAASFLLGIMIQTAVWKVKIVKDSAMATLLALPPGDRAYLEEQAHLSVDGSRGSNEHTTDMTQNLQAVTCRFRTGERGWALGLSKREDG